MADSVIGEPRVSSDWQVATEAIAGPGAAGSYRPEESRGKEPQPRGHGLPKREIRLAVACFVAWLILFVGGILIPTAPYREIISTLDIGLAFIGSMFVVVAFYTVTNVLLLCMLAALLGAAGNRAVLEPDGSQPARDHSNPYTSALIRAFVVYLLVLSGTMISLENPIDHFVMASQAQYVRMAALLSTLGFIVGYNPARFTDWFRRNDQFGPNHTGEPPNDRRSGSSL